MARMAAAATMLHPSACTAEAALVELTTLGAGILASAPSTTGIPAIIPPEPALGGGGGCVELGPSDPLVALPIVGTAWSDGVCVRTAWPMDGGAGSVRLVAVEVATCPGAGSGALAAETDDEEERGGEGFSFPNVRGRERPGGRIPRWAGRWTSDPGMGPRDFHAGGSA